MPCGLLQKDLFDLGFEILPPVFEGDEAGECAVTTRPSSANATGCSSTTAPAANCG